MMSKRTVLVRVELNVSVELEPDEGVALAEALIEAAVAGGEALPGLAEIIRCEVIDEMTP